MYLMRTMTLLNDGNLSRINILDFATVASFADIFNPF